MARMHIGVLYLIHQLHMIVSFKTYPRKTTKHRLYNRESRLRFYATIAHVLDMCPKCFSNEHSDSHSLLLP